MQETKKKTQTHAPFPQNGVYEINKHAAIAENGRASGLSFSLFFFLFLAQMLKSMLTCTDRESWIERHRYLNSPTSLSCSPQCIMERGLHFCSRGCCKLKGNFSTYQCTPSCFSETSRYRFCKSDKKEKRLYPPMLTSITLTQVFASCHQKKIHRRKKKWAA